MRNENVSKRRLYTLILGYSIVVIISYAVPVGLRDPEWFYIYSYLDAHKAVPFVNVREGYPPLGFLIYVPLYYAFHGDVVAFNYAFRFLNGAFLVSTLFVLYLIMRSSFSERKATKLAVYYATLPSVVIANVYSNDVIALLPAALSIYMMRKKKALLCGVLIGVATLCKGFPFLLIIPALIAFSKDADKVKVVGSAILTVLLASLPFMLINPYTYISTFTHVGSRGPWETVWALIDGYHSHGGLLHPYFDKFFYHSNLLKIYSASHLDHAVYKWSFDWMPLFLTICQIIVVVLLSLAFWKHRRDAYVLCGLLYIGYMLFFKGYSTQFAVSTPFYMLLAVVNNPLPFMIPLELSHILQMLAWGSNIISPESLRNWHLPLLVSAIILRTGVFGWVVLSNLRGVFTNIGFQVKLLFGRFLNFVKVFWDKKLFMLTLVTILFGAISLGFLYPAEGKVSFKSYSGFVNASVDKWENITLTGLNKGDQVALKLNTHTWIDAEIVPNDLKVPIERGIRNPFNLKDAFNETLFFFIAESESYVLMVRMAHQSIPFRVTDGLNGDLKVNVTVDGSAMVLKLVDYGLNGKGSIFRIAHPLDVYVSNDFSLDLQYKIMMGNAKLYLDVFDDSDDWLYPFQPTEKFALNVSSKDLYGYSNLYGDHISLFALTVFIDDGASTIIKIEEIKVKNSGKVYNLKFYAMESEDIPYEIFIERDFEPNIYYISFLSMFVTFCIITFHFSCRKVERLKFTFHQCT